jgi:hypothetical protein
VAIALAVIGSTAAQAEPSPWLKREVYRNKVERAAKAGELPLTVSRSHVDSCERRKLSPRMCARLAQ